MFFSLIIPVFNRPDEVDELLSSLAKMEYQDDFEIIIVEDGSSLPCKEVLGNYTDRLHISYYFKPNSGPGDSRNYGMTKAKGDYFIIFDSDCIVPPQYLATVSKELQINYVDCFGGPDKALDSFSDIQKAINFAMTSFMTTGGIRGGSEKIDKFQPRSFNMGISKAAFLLSGGFGNIHPGEDPDLSMRLWKLNLSTRLFPNAFVYHKRRIDWTKFSIQVNQFGKARPILNSWHPEYVKLAYFAPAIFVIGFWTAILLVLFNVDILLQTYSVYFLAVLVLSAIQNKSLKIGLLSVVAVWKQFFGYGNGFIKSFFKISVLGQNPMAAFPELFFKS